MCSDCGLTEQLLTSQKEDWPQAAGAKAALGTVKHHSADNCYVPNFSADEKGLSLGINIHSYTVIAGLMVQLVRELVTQS